MAVPIKWLRDAELQNNVTINSHRSAWPRRVIPAAVVASIFGAAALISQWYFAPDLQELATSALKRGDQATAISLLRQHVDEFPDSSAVKLRLASLLRDSDPLEALDYLNRIPGNDPHRLTAVKQIAVLCIFLERTAEAETALLELLADDSDNLGAQLSLAELYFQGQKPESALPHALEAARLAPERAETFLLLAEIHDELKDPVQMIEPLQTAIAIAPNLYVAHLNLAYAFHKTGHADEAELQARWCLQRDPADVAALRILASAERDLGRLDDAEQHLMQALQIAPEDLDCRILEADLLLYHRKPQQAYERLKQLSDAHSRTVRFIGALARAAASSGNRDEARRLFAGLSELLENSRPESP